MKLTRASSYALHAVLHLAVQKTAKPIASHKIAQARKIPERFLLKVLKPLVSARVLVSIKGPNGGYRLAREPREINMLEIIEAVDGPIRGYAPFHLPQNSAVNKKLDKVINQVADLMQEHLRKVKLSELLGKK